MRVGYFNNNNGWCKGARVEKKKKEKIASLDKKNKRNKKFCQLENADALEKMPRHGKKRHKNRQMMVAQNALMVALITTDARMFLYFFVSPSGVFTEL